MNILSIDTSQKSFSLTISKNNKYYSFIDTSEKVSSETVLIEIDELVSKCKLLPNDINTVIHNSGPGSFTGVRVSSAIVQAIGYSNDCPVYGINSLLIDAYSLYKKNNNKYIQVIKKAFGDQAFHGSFVMSDKECTLNEDVMISTYTNVEIKNNYFLLTNYKDIISESKNDVSLIDNYIGSELLIDYYELYCDKKKDFNYKDALPSYAGHTI